jgi:outer membrane PBP1 activator LpoA protein
MLVQALRINESRARHRRVQQIVGGELQFETRRREDIDIVLIAGRQSLALRQLRPLLLFYGAGDIPTYMTSDGFDADATSNRDLDGMRFPDMPWILQSAGPVAEIRKATESSWSVHGQRQSRLFAFGYDAGALAVALRNRQTNWPVAGLTGKLSPTPGGRVERDLDWARIRDGAAQLYFPTKN